MNIIIFSAIRNRFMYQGVGTRYPSLVLYLILYLIEMTSRSTYVHFFLFHMVLCFVGGKSSDVCPPAENKNSCEARAEQSVTICEGRLQEYLGQNNDFVKILSVCYWPNELFNTSDVLSLFPNIQKFTLSKSKMTKMLEDFPDFSSLKVLNITYTSIEHLGTSVFSKLNLLEVLDLRHNKLRVFNPSYVANLSNLGVIFLADNHYSCGDNFSWITFENNTFNKLIVDVEDMMCSGHRYHGKPLKRVMEIIETLKSECHQKVPINCTCVLDYVIRVSGNNLRPMITVNCSHQHFTTLPSKLPASTSTLIMRGNMISDLSEFITNESYFKLLNVYLDYNNISSINTLAASSWLTTFRALGLKGNHLSEMPLYVLENILEKNRNIGKILLSENPWKCDCVFTPLFKNFLVKYRSVIKDSGNVRCADRKGDENSLIPIISLNRNKLCKEKTSFKLSFVNFLSICFSVLLILLLVDFVRNYYMYKKYSKLPWMVNKFPC